MAVVAVVVAAAAAAAAAAVRRRNVVIGSARHVTGLRATVYTRLGLLASEENGALVSTARRRSRRIRD